MNDIVAKFSYQSIKVFKKIKQWIYQLSTTLGCPITHDICLTYQE